MQCCYQIGHSFPDLGAKFFASTVSRPSWRRRPKPAGWGQLSDTLRLPRPVVHAQRIIFCGTTSAARTLLPSEFLRSIQQLSHGTCVTAKSSVICWMARARFSARLMR